MFLMCHKFMNHKYHHQASSIPEWCKAMSEEIVALKTNRTWTVQTLPLGKKIIGYKWNYKTKFNAGGSLDKHKA